MEVLECLKTRRSIRSFTNEPVSKEEIEKVIEGASYAPSWKNSQSVRYIAVIDEDVIEKVANECMMHFEWNKNIVKNAPALIVVTTINGWSGYERDGSESTSKGSHWQSFDAGIAAQTLCLAAHGHGLGTVIMGVYDEAKVIDVLEVPEGQSVSALIAIGHPAVSPEMPARRDVETLLSFR